MRPRGKTTRAPARPVRGPRTGGRSGAEAYFQLIRSYALFAVRPQGGKEPR